MTLRQNADYDCSLLLCGIMFLWALSFATFAFLSCAPQKKVPKKNNSRTIFPFKISQVDYLLMLLIKKSLSFRNIKKTEGLQERIYFITNGVFYNSVQEQRCNCDTVHWITVFTSVHVVLRVDCMQFN